MKATKIIQTTQIETIIMMMNIMVMKPMRMTNIIRKSGMIHRPTEITIIPNIRMKSS